MNVGNVESFCKEVARQFIRKAIPKEAPFFEVIWDVLRQRIFLGNEILSPERWGFEASRTDIIDGLGLHGGEDLQTISIVSTLTALMIAMISSEKRSSKVLDELAIKYGSEFGTPAWAIPHIKSLVERGIKEYSVIIGGKKISSTYQYVVYEGAHKHYFTEEKELERFRNRKRKYDVYVDDPRSEILVRGEAPDLSAGENAGFRLLKCLLEKVGDHWTHDVLFEMLGMLDNEDLNSKTAASTERRILLLRQLESIRKSFSAKAGVRRVGKWFDSSNPGRFSVASNLNSCLIKAIS